MTITWQDATTAAIVLVALAHCARYLLRRFRRKGSPGCGCCTKCPAESSESALIALDVNRDEQNRQETASGRH